MLTNSLEAKPLGTESGGGGSVYRDNDGDLKLLDFKAVNYKSSYFYHLFSENHIVETEESFLFNEKQNSSVFKNVGVIMHEWSNIPLDIMSSYINLAITKPKWEFTHAPLLKPDFAAYYTKNHNSKFNVQISINKWNQLSGFDQAGLLIHEMYRQIQIGLNMGYDDDSLKRATLLTMFCKPTINLSFYIWYNLSDKEIAQKIYGKFEHFMEDKCL